MPVHTTNSSGCFSEIKKSRYFKEMILFIIIVLKFHIKMITLKEDSFHGWQRHLPNLTIIPKKQLIIEKSTKGTMKADTCVITVIKIMAKHTT